MVRYFWIMYYFFKDLFNKGKQGIHYGKSHIVIRYARTNGIKINTIKMSK